MMYIYVLEYVHVDVRVCKRSCARVCMCICMYIYIYKDMCVLARKQLLAYNVHNYISVHIFIIFMRRYGK